MIDRESHLRSTLRASFDAVQVPPPPTFSLRKPASRTTPGVLAAVAIMVALGVTAWARDGSFAQSLGQTLSFFVREGNRTVASSVPSISLDAALRTPNFHVIRPAGLPETVRFVKAQRFSSGGSAPVIVFSYQRAGHHLFIIETHEGTSPPTEALTSVRIVTNCNANDCAGQVLGFPVGSTRVYISADGGALPGTAREGELQISRIEAAMRREWRPEH